MINEKMMVKKAEIKRVGERLTKREFCEAFGIGYSYWMNLVSGRNLPSEKAQGIIEEYLETKVGDVYKRVFNLREVEDISGFHANLEINDKDIDKVYKELVMSGVWE